MMPNTTPATIKDDPNTSPAPQVSLLPNSSSSSSSTYLSISFCLSLPLSLDLPFPPPPSLPPSPSPSSVRGSDRSCNLCENVGCAIAEGEKRDASDVLAQVAEAADVGQARAQEGVCCEPQPDGQRYEPKEEEDDGEPGDFAEGAEG
eukprot:755095-Hanusia_phi.AAC.2